MAFNCTNSDSEQQERNRFTLNVHKMIKIRKCSLCGFGWTTRTHSGSVSRRRPDCWFPARFAVQMMLTHLEAHLVPAAADSVHVCLIGPGSPWNTFKLQACCHPSFTRERLPRLLYRQRLIGWVLLRWLSLACHCAWCHAVCVGLSVFPLTEAPLASFGGGYRDFLHFPAWLVIGRAITMTSEVAAHWPVHSSVLNEMSPRVFSMLTC